MGSKEELIEKAYQYLEGDEENGIFIDRKKAKEYFDKAGWDDMDCEEDTSTKWEVMKADYYLQGAPVTLDGIKTMVDDLAHRYGTPDNELGMYIPLEVLMQLLVGSPHYHGNLISMEEEARNSLVLHVEAETTEPFLHALRQAFPNLEVTYRELG
ncbi:MAG: hypothetical protein IJ693_02565 [Bacteroidaceae bacterium]|nr:hypothetical protein [Bacteroidaceae bacterium]